VTVEQSLVDLIVVGGPPVIGLLLLILVAGARKVWVWGRELDACEALCAAKAEELSEWRDLALRGLGAAEAATEKAKRVIG
jgi:ornithine cyclodeaminase/alanine dehydrogenase-like protein (mu-crystallin family)